MGLKKSQFTNTNPNFNVQFSVTDGSLTITPARLTITAADQKYTYNGGMQGEGGTAYKDPAEIAEKVTVEGLQGSDAVTGITLYGQGKNAGGYELAASNAAIGEATGSYEIEYVAGSLTIKPRTVTMTSADASKEYDGKPLTNEKVTVSGDGFAEGEGAVYKVTGSQTEVGGKKNNNTFTYTLNEGTLAENYEITTAFGTLTVTAPEKTEYHVLEGANGKVTKNSGKGLTFRIDGEYSKFTGIKIDSKAVDSSLYDSRSGSTIVTLKAACIDQLSVGKHTIQFLYTDGSCKTSFEVRQAATPTPTPTPTKTPTNGNGSSGRTAAKTGDSSSMGMWMVLLAAAAAGIAMTLVWRRRIERK